jgi:enoyl-CoA hydratase/carnithine racemase
VLNRLQAEDVSSLRELFERVNRDQTLRALVITGEGRVFCSGYDLDDLGERSGALPTTERTGNATPGR